MVVSTPAFSDSIKVETKNIKYLMAVSIIDGATLFHRPNPVNRHVSELLIHLVNLLNYRKSELLIKGFYTNF